MPDLIPVADLLDRLDQMLCEEPQVIAPNPEAVSTCCYDVETDPEKGRGVRRPGTLILWEDGTIS